jgi:glycosyltransferase involved in cell wall biosynthesis
VTSGYNLPPGVCLPQVQGTQLDSHPMSDSSLTPPIRLLVILEGTTVSGPAKNVLAFCRVSRGLGVGPAVSTSFAVFVRGDNQGLATETRSNELLEALKATGADVHSIQERFPFDPGVIGGLRELVKRLEPDIIETHFVKSHFLVRLSRVWRFCPWVAFHHGYTTDARRTLIYNQLDRWSLRVPSRIVTVCQAFKRQLSSRGVPAARISILHNGVPSDWLNGCERMVQPEPGVRSEIGQRVRERVVLAVGRLSKEKAFDDLLVAINKLGELRPDLLVRLLIVGEGPERARIERVVHNLKLQDRVRMVGHVRDVGPYYRMANALAISSVSEGSPNVLLEAMAAGVPVVATSVGGIPEIVTDGKTALLREPRDPYAMAAALSLLFSDSPLSEALVREAQELIKNRYSPHSRTRFLLKLYEQVAPRLSADFAPVG